MRRKEARKVSDSDGVDSADAVNNRVSSQSPHRTAIDSCVTSSPLKAVRLGPKPPPLCGT